MRCHSTRIISKNRTRLISGSIYPHRPQQTNFLRFDFCTFPTLSLKPIKNFKVLICNLFSFYNTFRSLLHSLLSDHCIRFSILRLYIVVAFANSPGATVCPCVRTQRFRKLRRLKTRDSACRF